MTELLALTGPLLVGAVMGLMFFGGLWWSLKRALSSAHPAWGLTLSLGLRTGLVLLGFYVLVTPRWPDLLSSLLGFTLARLLLSRYLPAAAPPAARGGSPCT